MIGPLADTIYEDWYSGTLPYAVTVRAALTERLGADGRGNGDRGGPAVSYAEGVDRISLSCQGRYVVAADSPDGAPLTLHSGGDVGEAAWFDLFDWGQGVDAVRAVANGRHVSVDDDGLLVNDQARPNGWVVRETFRLVERLDGVVIHHVATDRYVAVDPDGRLRADAADPADATVFTVELVSSGIAAATAAAQEADVAIVVLGNHPLINGRETEDRADLALPAAQEALVRAVYAANPRTVLALTSSYPFGIGWAHEHLPAMLWSAHGGQEFGHALADVLFGDADPAGRLTQTWYRVRGRPARPVRLRHHRRPTRPTSTSAARRSTRSATACRTPPSNTGTCGSAPTAGRTRWRTANHRWRRTARSRCAWT